MVVLKTEFQRKRDRPYAHDLTVDRLFACASDIGCRTRTCPVTGRWFIPGEISIFEIKAHAVRALQVREAFDQKYSAMGWAPFPLNNTERQICAEHWILGKIVASYSHYAAYHEFHVQRLQEFYDYACGMMGHPVFGPRLALLDTSLVRRYPSRPARIGEAGTYVWTE